MHLYRPENNRETILNPTLPQLTYIEIEDKPDSLGGEGMEFLVTCKITDIWTRLQVLLEKKLSGHTDILTEARPLIDEINEIRELQNIIETLLINLKKDFFSILNGAS